MKPILFAEDATSFITNGFGRMTDAISCKVVEERNGEYELTMTYPVNGRHFSDLSERMLLYSIHDDKKDRQPFRIYEISKPLNGIVTIHARHVSYDLNKIVISPFTAGSCGAAFSGLKNNSATVHDFQFFTNKSLTADFKIEVPTVCRSILGGTEGSILDIYGPGEYQWDHWNVHFYSQRGQDKPVEIRYGKNLTELEDTVNIGNTYNAVYPFWKGQEEGTDSQGKTVYVSKLVYISDNPSERILRADLQDDQGHTITLPLEVVPLDLSSEWDKPPTQDELRSKAASYLTANKPWLESRNITVSFVALWQTEEYKNLALERVSLCDTVRVIHNKLGISVRKKIVKVDYDVLNERYNSIELGDSSKSFTSALKSDITSGMGDMKTTISTVQGLITPKSEIDNAIDSAVQHASELIRGGLGGYVIMNTNANGQPEEIVISDNLDLSQAQNVWRWNKNGLAFSNNGYDFDDEHPDTLKLALTADGAIVADRITSGSLTANIITAGVLTAGNGNTTLDMSTGRLVAKNFKIDTSSVEGSSFEIDSSKFKVAPNGDVSIINGLFDRANVEYSLSVKRSTDPNYGNFASFLTNHELIFGTYDYNRGVLDRWLFNISTGHNNLMSMYGHDYPETLIDIDSGNEGGLAFNTYSNDLTRDAPILFINTGKNPNGHTEDVLVYGNIGIVYPEFKKIEDWPEGAIDPSSFDYFNDRKVTIEPSYYNESKEPLLIIRGHVAVDGDISCLNGALVARGGQKYRAVDTKHYGTVGLAAMESPEPVFADFGSNTLDSDGKCYVEFESIFAETIDLSRNYQVFYTQTSPGKIDYVEKRSDKFIVHGEPGTEFDWIVYAKQIDFSNCRFTRLDNKGKGDTK